MGIEIERKFLVLDDTWRVHGDQGIYYRQGYLTVDGNSSVRVRIEGDKANLNIKSAEISIRRTEYEYTIPLVDAEEMLQELCAVGVVEKRRYRVPVKQHVWEVDVFEGGNQGLIVAEVELADENELFHRPEWAGVEVSHDPRYYNVNLVSHPYKDW